MNVQMKTDQIQSIAMLIREMLGDDFDDQTFLDTLDGETDVMDMLGHLVKARLEAQEIERAMKEIAATYTARAKRHASRVKSYNEGIGKLLDAIGERKVMHPMATISRTAPRVSLSITDIDEVPTQLCKRVPDSAAVKTALEAGETVPGAALQQGAPGVTVRVK